jgi:EAL domain-containing protein (putative c-di-GMP-specific phosphodiesterase class I)
MPRNAVITNRQRGVTSAYLECYPEQGGPVQRVPLLRLPFLIGRSETADHTIYSSKVSKEHATIAASGDGFVVRDLDSTNGTFVNGKRITEDALADGDIIQVAHVEFRFRHPAVLAPALGAPADSAVEQTHVALSDQTDSIILGTQLMRELISREAVEILYQPIVDLQSGEVIGFEALGRGAHAELSRSPEVLFGLAERCGLTIELSRLFRRAAVASSHRLPPGPRIFVNVHAAELRDPGFIESLAGLRRGGASDRRVVLEIAESSVTDVAAMADRKAAFTRLGLEFAYDDFGAGQARLLELADIPPDYLKFDKVMIQGIDQAAPRQEMVAALLTAVRKFGVRVIAEGIETEPVAAICQRLGCEFGQGYLFGRPA